MFVTPSEQSKKLIALGQRYFVPNYKPREIVLDKGMGARIWDLDGNEYIDLGAGISVNSLGHQDPDIVDALVQQAKKLWHTTNIYFTEPAVKLAEELAAATFADQVYFCNSGAEANEAAIKLARKYSSENHGSGKREIITFEGSFHGRTLATVTATAQPKFQQGFEPLPGGFTYCAFNDFAAIESLVSAETCAILVEPIQGEGGVMPAAPGFLKHLRDLCDRHQALLMFDEVQTGIGRTGKFFAYQWEQGWHPDVVTVAKALGGGFPIGAMLTTEKIAAVLQFGSHGSTFGGNLLGAAVARAVIKKVTSPDLLSQVCSKGELLKQKLEEINKNLNMFADIRGKGLMIGAELKEEWHGNAGELTESCRHHGVLILQAGPNVLRFLPPLTISDEELGEGMGRVAMALAQT